MYLLFCAIQHRRSCGMLHNLPTQSFLCYSTAEDAAESVDLIIQGHTPTAAAYFS